MPRLRSSKYVDCVQIVDLQMCQCVQIDAQMCQLPCVSIATIREPDVDTLTHLDVHNLDILTHLKELNLDTLTRPQRPVA